MPQGLKPLLLPPGEKAKAKALAYLDARATTAAITVSLRYGGKCAAFDPDDVLFEWCLGGSAIKSEG